MNAPLKDNNISIVTLKLFGLILKMPLQDRLQLLTEVERKQQDIKNDNRREYDRQDYLINIDYTVKDHFYKGLSINLSANGVFIESSKSILPKFSPGDELMLSFDHPGKKEPIKITGRIARIDKKGIGVMFSQPILDW
jgi:hypothetical protein